jgi:hypothetical protein
MGCARFVVVSLSLVGRCSGGRRWFAVAAWGSRCGGDGDSSGAGGGFAGGEEERVAGPLAVVVGAGDAFDLGGLGLVAGEEQLFAVEAEEQLVLLAFGLTVPEFLDADGVDVDDMGAPLQVLCGEVEGVKVTDRWHDGFLSGMELGIRK